MENNRIKKTKKSDQKVDARDHVVERFLKKVLLNPLVITLIVIACMTGFAVIGLAATSVNTDSLDLDNTKIATGFSVSIILFIVDLIVVLGFILGKT